MSSYSPDLRIELIDSGAQAGTWGTTTNNTFAYLLEAAIAGYQTVSVTSASQALTYINGASSTAGDNQSVYAMLRFTTTTGAAFNVYAPPASKQYIVYNNSGYSMTIYNSTVIGNTTAAGTGVTIADGAKIMVWSDGTNFSELQAANLTGTLAINKGGTGQTTQQAAINALAGTQTNNRVLRSDGTNTTLSQVNVATDVTGTLALANGGTGVTSLTALGNLFYPVGSIYTSTVSTNPGSSLGFGTWTAFSAGRVMIGAGGGYSAGATGGSADSVIVDHTHGFSGTTGAMNSNASHSHSTVLSYYSPDAAAGTFSRGGSANFTSTNGTNAANIDHTHGFSGTTAGANGGTSGTNANLQPYIVVYMWQRTA